MNYTFGIGVTIFNIIILIVLIASYVYHKRQLKLIENEDLEFDYSALEEEFQSGRLTFKLSLKKAISITLIKLATTFHFWMFYINSFLVVANFFAFVTGILGYFFLNIVSADIMLFGRLADRTTMCFAFIGLSIMGRLMFRIPKVLK